MASPSAAQRSAPLSPPDDALLAPLVGPRWERHYRERFAAFDAGGSPLGWNAEAALTPLWGFRRRIPVLRALALPFPFVGIALAFKFSLAVGVIVPTVIWGVLHGLFGDWCYWQHLRGVQRRVAALPVARRAEVLRDATVAGPGETAGAVAAGAVLAAILVWMALPKGFGPEQLERERRGQMKADLRNVITAQEVFYTDSGYYASVLPAAYYEASSGVVVRMLYVDARGFAADAVRGTERCTIFWGPRRYQPASEEAGTPRCTFDDRVTR